MPQFVMIGYGDDAGHQRRGDSVRATENEAALIKAGAPIKVRNPDGGGVSTDADPYLQSALPVAGFAVIEAADLDKAIAKVSGSPCAVAHGVIEIWL